MDALNDWRKDRGDKARAAEWTSMHHERLREQHEDYVWHLRDVQRAVEHLNKAYEAASKAFEGWAVGADQIIDARRSLRDHQDECGRQLQKLQSVLYVKDHQAGLTTLDFSTWRDQQEAEAEEAGDDQEAEAEEARARDEQEE